MFSAKHFWTPTFFHCVSSNVDIISFTVLKESTFQFSIILFSGKKIMSTRGKFRSLWYYRNSSPLFSSNPIQPWNHMERYFFFPKLSETVHLKKKSVDLFSFLLFWTKSSIELCFVNACTNGMSISVNFQWQHHDLCVSKEWHSLVWV